MWEFPAISRKYLFLALFGVTILVYGNTFRNDWTYDDRYVVVDNPDIRSLEEFFQNQYPGRPLREISYLVDYQLFGTSPAGYHFQQLLWHGLNGCLLLTLALALGVPPLAAFLGTMLFLLHPLQVESVANVGHRKELLALFFSLLALLAHIKGVAATGTRRILLVASAFLAYGGALFSNAATVFLPLVLALYEHLFVPAHQRLLLRKPLWSAGVGTSVLGLALYHFRGAFMAAQLAVPYTKNGFDGPLDRFPYYMGGLKVFALYLCKLLLPLNLAPEYAVRFYADPVQPWAFVGAGLLVLFALALVRSGTRRPVFTFAGGWFLFMYLPVANIIPISYMMADRYLYLCLPGVALLAAWLLERWPYRGVAVGFCLLLVVLAGLTVRQNGYWRDEHTLWRHAVQVNPDSSWAQSGVADSYIMSGDFSTARVHLRKALELNRFNVKAYLALARVEEVMGDLHEALRNYEIFQYAGRGEYPQLAAQAAEHIPLLREQIRQATEGNPAN
jgi:protein O-mannosyl-transferase